MATDAFSELAASVAAETLTAHPLQVDAWITGQAGAWGYLAGQAILACRRRLGRSLGEAERRIVWQQLWDQLQRACSG